MPRTRGWGGNPPVDDDEARARIIEAAKRCLDRFGPAKTGLADVAADLEVTRQTVYRHFRTTDELIYAAAAESSVDSWTGSLHRSRASAHRRRSSPRR